VNSQPASHRLVERVVLTCLFAVFAAATGIAYGYALKDALGPGPGFFPFWLGLTGATLSLVLLAQSLRGRAVGGGAEGLWPDRAGGRRAAALLGGLVLFALLLEPAGFRLTAFVVTAALLVALGVRRPVVIAAFALVASLGLFHVFYHWLKVPLPVGPFGL
jgi:putative tricarboxylic transport membrane protein